jgi:diguanylate cyclase (GGDEF)-like protein
MRVVLVAANLELSESITTMLRFRRHEVVCFAEGGHALHLMTADQSADALIVADAQNTDAAVELCWYARLLANIQRPIYICLLAGPMTSEAMVEALDCGADDVLRLPLCADELYARLRSAERLNQIQLKLFEMATRDGLTGLLNRRAFFFRASELCRDARAPMSAIMVDIDHFKTVNDKFGHLAGDEALRAVAQRLMGFTEIAGRLGGEEFALLLPGSDAEQARGAAEVLRREIHAQEIEVGPCSLMLSCSFGVAARAPGETIDDILRRADAALYQAKRRGRNLVVTHDAGDVRAASSSGGRRAAIQFDAALKPPLFAR